MLQPAEIRRFQANLHGELIQPGHDRYEEARKVFNGMIDKRPALIARCADVPDVVAAVNFAQGTRAPGSGARRRSRSDGYRRVRRRAGYRSLGDEERAGRPGESDGSGRCDCDRASGRGHPSGRTRGDCYRAAEPFLESWAYVNYLGEEGEGRLRAAYGENFERLAAIKKKYDPTNFFSSNQNIRPA